MDEFDRQEANEEKEAEIGEAAADTAETVQADVSVQQEDNAAEKKKIDVKKEIWEWVKSILIALIIVFIIRTFLFTMIRVDGTSMLETLQDGDRIASTIIDLKIQGPQRGSIVICTYPGADHYCIKRVIGMPGDTLQIVRGVTYINGEVYDEPYITHPRTGDYYGPITLGEDEYFVMGDNRAVSHDSRAGDVGPLKKGAINANARLRLWPLNSIGLVG